MKKIILENTLYTNDTEKNQLLASGVPEIFLFNFLGMIAAFQAARDNTKLKKYFKDDLKIRLNSITDDNNNSSIAVKMMQEKGYFKGTVARDMTRFLAKMKIGGVDNIDTAIIKSWLEKVTPQFEMDLPPKLRTLYTEFRDNPTSSLESLANALRPLARKSNLSKDFVNTTKSVRFNTSPTVTVPPAAPKTFTPTKAVPTQTTAAATATTSAAPPPVVPASSAAAVAAAIAPVSVPAPQIIEPSNTPLRDSIYSDKKAAAEIFKNNWPSILYEAHGKQYNSLDLYLVRTTLGLRKFSEYNEREMMVFLEREMQKLNNEQIYLITNVLITEILDTFSGYNKPLVDFLLNEFEPMQKNKFTLFENVPMMIFAALCIGLEKINPSSMTYFKNTLKKYIESLPDFLIFNGGKAFTAVGLDVNFKHVKDIIDEVNPSVVGKYKNLTKMMELKISYNHTISSIDSMMETATKAAKELHYDFVDERMEFINSKDISTARKIIEYKSMNSIIKSYIGGQFQPTFMKLEELLAILDSFRTVEDILEIFMLDNRENFDDFDDYKMRRVSISALDRATRDEESFLSLVQQNPKIAKKIIEEKKYDLEYTRWGKNRKKQEFADTLIDNVLTPLFDEKDTTNLQKVFDVVDMPYIENRARETLTSSAILKNNIEKGPIFPRAKISKERLTEILGYNDFDFVTEAKKTGINTRKKKNETLAEYVTRITHEFENSEDITPKLQVEKVEISEKETIALEKTLVDQYHSKGTHGNIFPKILNVFEATLSSEKYEAYKSTLPESQNLSIFPAFHGTGGIAASMIMRFGFAVLKPNDPSIVGRMLGPGIYFTNVLDKTLRYTNNSGYAKGYGLIGYLLSVDNVLGNFSQRAMYDQENQEWFPSYSAAGTGKHIPDHAYKRVLSPEYCVRNPKKQLKILRVYEVEIVPARSYNKRVDSVVVEGTTKSFKNFLSESVLEEINQTEVNFIFSDNQIPILENGEVVSYPYDDEKVEKFYGEKAVLEPNQYGTVLSFYFEGTDLDGVFRAKYANRMSFEMEDAWRGILSVKNINSVSTENVIQGEF